MKIIASAIILSCLGTMSPLLMAKDKVILSRVTRNADGSISELKEIDKNTIVRVTLHEKKNGERVISSKSTYSVDSQERPRVCIITDGSNKPLFKIRYGYSKTTGRLMSEGMFDQRAVRRNAKGQEIPIQRLYYKYDPHGVRSKPYSITSQPGKPAKEVEGWADHIQKRLDAVHHDGILSQQQIDAARGGQ